MKNLFNAQVWQEILLQIKDWLTEELPGILIMIILFFIAFRIVAYSVGKLRKKLIRRAEKNENTDTDEAMKRINTLTRISHNLIKVILWAVFIMMILQKLGLDIGPILA